MLTVENLDVDVCEDVERAQISSIVAADNTVALIRESMNGVGSNVCHSCGDDIPPARRKAYPSAKRCAPCQTDFERSACAISLL